MRRITATLLRREQGRLLDAGCGPGWDLAGLPPGIQEVGLDRDARLVHIRPFVMADVGRLPFAAAAFDVVVALDLLEQRGLDPMGVLFEMRRVLRPGGQLLIRVPAHPWLFGPHDLFWGGVRRYRRTELAELVTSAGFCLLRLTYVNTLLFPVAVAGRLLARAHLVGGIDMRPVPGPLNALLLAVLGLEARWLAHGDLPVGLSLMCLAEGPRNS
jgi:SAM-dependent methyltransferase